MSCHAFVKLLTMNAADTQVMIQLAKEKDMFLMEGVWMRFFSAMVDLRRLIADGAIGNVKYVNVAFGFRRKSDANQLTQFCIHGVWWRETTKNTCRRNFG